MSALDDCYNVFDLRDAAKRRLPKAMFEFVDRSTEDEVALRNNRAAFERIRMRHRALVDVERAAHDEAHLLQLVADGQSNKEIGTALGLSALTVKSHLARIARKLGTGDRAELVMISLRSGLIS